MAAKAYGPSGAAAGLGTGLGEGIGDTDIDGLGTGLLTPEGDARAVRPGLGLG
jgi:hypothetical protein